MKTRMRMLGVVGAAALLATGCGNLTIRSWVKVITADSSGSLQADLLGPNPVPISRLQGGFLGQIVVDTTKIPAPLDGTVNIDDVRIAGDTAPSPIGAICVWANPASPSSGTIHLDILGGTGSVTLTLNLKAQAALSDLLGQPPVEVSQSATFPLGGGFGLSQLLTALNTGSADGLFATSASFVGDTTLGGLPASFTLDLSVNNEGKPPLFAADLLSACNTHFAEQGRDTFYSINSKSSYLLASSTDSPQPPLVIPLADLHALPGNTLQLNRIGTYDEITELKDGSLTKVAAVFSSSSTVNAPNQRNRIPGAIDAGTDVTTKSYLVCLIWPFCTTIQTDITQDFAFTSGATVTIPAGAQYLIVGTIPDSLTWGDNSGFGLGVQLTVNP